MNDDAERRRATFALDARPASVPAARAWLRDLLTGWGRAVLLDDRAGKISPGVKFKDAELIGVPTIVTVGRGLVDGTVEVRDRRTDERIQVEVGTAAEQVAALIRG